MRPGAPRCRHAAGPIQRREVRAEQVLLGAGAIEMARMLLSSPSAREPNGLGTNRDQMVRHLQGHAYAGTVALFAEVL